MKTRLYLTAALCIGAALPAQADTLEDIKAAGKVVAGYANTVPFSYLDADGNLTGQAIELARAAFGAMDIEEIEGVLIDFPGLIPALQADQFDIIAASMAIRPARCEQILFSDPYSAVQMVLVARDGVEGDFANFETLAASGARFGVQAGSVEAELARNAGVENITEFPDLASLRDGVRVGRADVLMTITISVGATMEAIGAGFTAGEPFAPMVDGKPQVNFQAFGFRRGDEALRDAFNAEVAKLRESGELLTLFAPFGLTEADIALAAENSAATLCEG